MTEKWNNKRAVISDSRVYSYHLMKTKKPRRIRYAMYNKLSANWKMLEGINVTSANTTPQMCGIWRSMRLFRMLSIVWYKTVSLYCSIGCSQSSHILSSQEMFFLLKFRLRTLSLYQLWSKIWKRTKFYISVLVVQLFLIFSSSRHKK